MWAQKFRKKLWRHEFRKKIKNIYLKIFLCRCFLFSPISFSDFFIKWFQEFRKKYFKNIFFLLKNIFFSRSACHSMVVVSFKPPPLFQLPVAYKKRDSLWSVTSKSIYISWGLAWSSVKCLSMAVGHSGRQLFFGALRRVAVTNTLQIEVFRALPYTAERQKTPTLLILCDP